MTPIKFTSTHNSHLVQQACSWPTVNQIHPFAPVEQTEGYMELIRQLEKDLAEITGYDHVCLTPNSGAMGEYAGLRTITGYLASKGQSQRKVSLHSVIFKLNPHWLRKAWGKFILFWVEINGMKER